MSLTPAQILYLHELALQYGGGMSGIRDLGLLESAVARAFQTFERKLLYSAPYGQAAACAHGIVRNHPFLDGNKRTAFLALGLWLQSEGRDFRPLFSEPVEMFQDVALGRITPESLAEWASKQCL